jgi:glycosyltransferase involved in cell wall biosynthesis
VPPDFSVIIPTYRRPRELAEAVGSVLGQSGATIEIIVVDDSPEGSAREVVEAIRDARVTFLKNTSPTGGIPSAVRNLGWPRAKGNFVHFLDDDDIVPDGHYRAVKDAFSAHPQVGMVFGRAEPFGNCPIAQLEHEQLYFADAAQRSLSCQRFGSKLAFVGRMLFGDALLVCSASVVRREILERLGGYDPGIRLMEDADFHVRAMREFGVYFMNRVAVRYRIGNPSLMHSPNPDELQLEMQRDGHRKMKAKYRKQRGALEFYVLALFTRTVLRVL